MRGKKTIDPDVLKIGKVKIKRGERKQILLEAAGLYDYTQLSIPVEVIRGKEKGPVLFISAAIHGDELNGVEIVRQILKSSRIKKIKGTLIMIPVVNIFGFNHKSRYLPDRRDLNRSFPGSEGGSLARRIAHIFMKEIVSNCSHGIDLHTAGLNRTNLPHVRASIDDESTLELAKSFGVPVIINSKTRDGSLREAARKKKKTILLFEGGQALRFENDVIRLGVGGCFSVMRRIGMLPLLGKGKKSEKEAYTAQSSHWIRAPRSGAFRSRKKVGDKIEKGDLLAVIANPFGKEEEDVIATEEGILIGSALLPLVNQGDAMFHIAVFNDSEKVSDAIDDLYFDE